MVLGMLVSCKKDPFISTMKTSPPPVTQQIADFPNQIGNTWVYREANDPLDTLIVKIVGNGVLPNGDSARLWQYEWKYNSWASSVIDTQWVSYSNNIAAAFNKPLKNYPTVMPKERGRYVFPLAVGSSWSTSYSPFDVYTVLGKQLVMVPGGRFPDTYQIFRKQININHEKKLDTLYFLERVGLVKFHQDQYNWVPVLGNGSWELISYQLH